MTIISLALGLPVGIVPRLPTAVLAAAIVITAVLVLMVGYILESFMHMRQEQARLAHLRYLAPCRGVDFVPEELGSALQESGPEAVA
ncbi:hypothetical protein ACFV2H_51520 [Streptomyces sp. NPDC059629]|uniref:hypothetical protein n=1 Tax=Streptomyces sp. NPDC059629 TaxID=3346889 RepID=UPI003690E379